MSKNVSRIFTIIDLHFGAMQPCSSGLGMTLDASDFRSVRRLVAYSTRCHEMPYLLNEAFLEKPHNLKRLTCHANAVGTYHYSHIVRLVCGRTDGGQTKYRVSQSQKSIHKRPKMAYIAYYIIQENKKFCKLKKREYRDGVKAKRQDRDGLVNIHTLLYITYCVDT